MGTLRLFSLALGALLLPVSLLAGDLQITCQKKAVEAAGRSKGPEGTVAKGEEQVVYSIAVSNTSSKETGPLEVRYIFLVERQTVGEKRGAARIERVRGSGKLDSLKTWQRGAVDTDP